MNVGFPRLSSVESETYLSIFCIGGQNCHYTIVLNVELCTIPDHEKSLKIKMGKVSFLQISVYGMTIIGEKIDLYTKPYAEIS